MGELVGWLAKPRSATTRALTYTGQNGFNCGHVLIGMSSYVSPWVYGPTNYAGLYRISVIRSDARDGTIKKTMPKCTTLFVRWRVEIIETSA